MGLAELQVVHVTPSVFHRSPRIESAPEIRVYQEEEESRADQGLCTLLAITDYAWSTMVVLPLVVGQWRGTWELMHHLTPEQHYERSLWWSLWLGSGLGVLFALLRRPLTRLANPIHPRSLPRRVAFVIFSRLYIIVFAAACIAQWRGTWDLISEYCGSSYQLHLFSIGLGGASLARLKSLRNLSGPPFNVALDLRQSMFAFPTRYRTSGGKDPALHALDCVFSVLVVGSLVVIVWRGTWGILDHVLLPHDPVASAWLSLGIGYGVSATGFALQIPARLACEKLSGAPRLVLADLYQFFCFWGTVNLWRGVWDLLNIYLLPETPLASYWLTHWSCLLLLMALGCANSLLVRGVMIDGEEEGGQCVVFQCNYLRHRYEAQSKRQAQQQQAAAVAAAVTLLAPAEKRKVVQDGGGHPDNNVNVTLMTPMRDTLL